MTEEQIGSIRRFNRSYTQRIGLLEQSYLGTDLPLGAARLLFEIGSQSGSVHQLRARLGLDSGYLSRLLRRLERRGLIELGPDPSDRRRRLVDLTEDGRRVWSGLEERSRGRAGQLLEPLTERQRARLVEALSTADLLVRAATVDFCTVAPDSELARVAVGHYVAELDRRFEDGFDPGPDPSDPSLGPPGGVFVVAVSDGEPVACGGLRTIDDQVGEVKRMWVDPRWRGAGLGSRLLRHLEAVAVDLGHTVIRLDTNATLTEAIAMYGRAGYREIDAYAENPYAQHWFEKRLR